MKNLRIFLTSDIHLGLKFSGYPEIQKELADARFETLERCVLRANEEKCHIFAVAQVFHFIYTFSFSSVFVIG